MAVSSQLLDMALAYLAGGVSLVPIDRRTKQPFFALLPTQNLPDGRSQPTWKPYQARRASPDEVRTWAKQGAQFAAACGAISGGLLIFDFDQQGALYEAWKVLVGNLADNLPVQRTGGGGYQVACRCPNPGPNDKLAWLPDEAAAMGRVVAIETRGEGGYAVLAPSLHPSGRRYEMISGSFTAIPMISQAHADALVAAARQLDQAPFTKQQLEKAAKAKPKRDTYHATVRGEESVIDAYNAKVSIYTALETHGYTKRGTRYCAPGAPKTIASSVVIFDDERSYHWDTNDGLCDGRSHTAFDVSCYYDHADDVKAAVKAAAKELGMERPAPEPTYDHEGYACCPVHLTRLPKAKNGNGYKCRQPDKRTDTGWCNFWWKGEGYIEPKPQASASIPKPVQQPSAIRTAEPWTIPLPFINHDLPTFPIDTFTPWLRDYVIAETEAKQTPLDLAAMLALSVLSTACARCVMVEAKPGWIEPVNLYTVTALPPASRKSPMFASMVAPINAYERELISQAQSDISLRQAEHEILEARLAAAKREAAQAKTKPEQLNAMEKVEGLARDLAHHKVPALPRYVVDDISTEMLSSMLAEHGRIAALSPEGDIFSIMGGRYSGDAAPNFGVYLKAHAGDTLRVDRRSRPSEFVEWPALTMGLTVQPDVIRGFGDKRSMRGLGLLGRFLYALPVSTVGRRKVNPYPVPEAIREQYLDRITYLLQQVPILAATYSGNSGNSGNEERGYRSFPVYEQEVNSENSGNCGNQNESEGVSSPRARAHNSENSENSGVSRHFSIYLSIYLLQLDSEAQRVLDEWQAWLEPKLAENGEFGAFADWGGKLTGAVVRIAGLLFLSDYADHNSHNSHNSISSEILARAITIGQYLIPHARAAFIEMGTDPAIHAARRVLAWIEQTQPHEFTKREAYQATKGTFKHAADLDPVLELLTYHSYIRPIETDERSGPGRKPSQRYEVNPLTYACMPVRREHVQFSSFVPSINGHVENSYSIDAITQGGHEVWRLWNDATNTIVGTYGSEEEVRNVIENISN